MALLFVGWWRWEVRSLRRPRPPTRAAALVETAGYVPVALSGDDYVELLPATWRAINAYGVKIKHRTYDDEALNPLRHQRSGVKDRKGLWEIHFDPYDVSRIWVRDHWRGGWITLFWKHLHRVAAPFGELAWDHTQRTWPGASEEELADAVAALLDRACHGPADRDHSGAVALSRRDRRVAARTKASPPATRVEQQPAPADADLRPVRRGGQALVSDPVGSRQDEDPTDGFGHLQLTTLAGWRGFVTQTPVVPDLLPEAIRSGLKDGQRACYDDDRIDHHCRLLVVQTPTIRQVVTTGRRLVQLNKNAHYGRCGLMVSGPARTGKTTALTQLGKTVEVIHQRRHPRSADDIPVVYVTVPPAATPKMIATEFARFFGLPLSHRGNITDIADAVCGVSLDARVTLVAVDELHNLNTATRAGAEASDTLKYFSERIPPTFVYAGISLERTGLLSGTRGEQIAGRFGMVRTGPFGRDPQWTALIAALEDSLRLHRHRPGTLTRTDRYLHQRTHGMIGSLLWPIRSAAVEAVLDGTEKITKKSLDAVEADITAQSSSPPAT